MVTGAGGFIASHLVEALDGAGAAVRAFARYTSRRDIGSLRLLPPDRLARLELVFGDLRDAEAVARACRGIDTVFHLGAVVSVPYSFDHPREAIETNVTGTLNVLLASRDQRVQKVVHASTSEIYGTALYVPIDERHQLQGQSPYSASKIGAEKIAQSFHCAYGLPLAVIRPFNTYGPRQSARAVIPSIITQALTRDEVRLGNLDPRRDFTFVADTVDAFMRVGACPQAVGQEINVGSGAEISIGELASKIIRLVERDVRIATDRRRERPGGSEVGRLVSDAGKAARLLGWGPKVHLEEGLKRTIDWISDHLHLYRAGDYEV